MARALAEYFGNLLRISSPKAGEIVAIEDLSGSAVYFWLASLVQQGRGPVFLVTENNEQAEASQAYFQSAIKTLGIELPEGASLFYPDFEPSSLFGYEPLSAELKEQMSRTQQALLANTARVVFLPYKALFRRTLGQELVRGSRLHLAGSKGKQEDHGDGALCVIELEELCERLVDFGYEYHEIVAAKGQFARRGGIVDVFPYGSYYPVRLDFFGDEIEEIRSIDPMTQRSIRPVDDVVILPASTANRVLRQPWARSSLEGQFAAFAREMRGRVPEGALSTLVRTVEADMAAIAEGQYPPRAGFYAEAAGMRDETVVSFASVPPILVFLEPALIENEARSYRHFWEARIAEWRASGLTFTDFSDYYRFPREPLPSWLEEAAAVASQLNWPTGEYAIVLAHSFKAGQSSPGWCVVSAGLENLQPRPYSTRRVADTVRESAAHHFIVSQFSQRIAEILREGDAEAEVFQGSLPRGFAVRRDNGSLALVTDLEIFGELGEVARRPARHHRTGSLQTTAELNPGDFVVHIDYGIGKFVALKQMEAKGALRTYLELSYAGGDKLFVPVDQLDRLKPYRAAGQPRLSSLTRGSWQRVKDKVRRDVLQYALRLLKLYRERKVAQGYRFDAASRWMEEFIQGFPYELTPDQAEAWKAAELDMESPRVMDRLICGEVGFGKTEIAMRAAFKACTSGKQVLMLCPTTILADQHYHTFLRRFRPFPFRVELLSRFQEPGEQRKIVEAAAVGRVDVLVATHRALSRDVQFKNLGLLIIDEEQRFGVRQKEELKLRYPQIDVLTLTATPIPRTLRLSLLGLMDISLLETPPPERKAVKTYVGEWNGYLVKDAILKELSRGGQVYFLHNRVRDIQRVARQLQELVPEARIGIAHGQLTERKLEAMMDAFNIGAFNLLLATTIIENGLDIPTVNTLIVDHSEILGLAQMHQLRGRVGRSRLKAYAYFFHSPLNLLTDEAKERLRAIYNYAYLGAGYEIAQQDLMIRGAGTILGTDQSGTIELVGMDYYLDLLTEAVEKIRELPEEFIDRGEIPWQREETVVQVDLPLPCYIPEKYVPDTPLRMRLYQRIASAEDEEALRLLHEEFEDRFGKLPQEVENLFYIIRLKHAARSAGVSQVSYIPAQQKLTLNFAGTRLARESTQASSAEGKAHGPSLSLVGSRSRNGAVPRKKLWLRKLPLLDSRVSEVSDEMVVAKVEHGPDFAEDVLALLERVSRLVPKESPAEGEDDAP